jgi:hypothetical protein
VYARARLFKKWGENEMLFCGYEANVFWTQWLGRLGHMLRAGWHPNNSIAMRKQLRFFSWPPWTEASDLISYWQTYFLPIPNLYRYMFLFLCFMFITAEPTSWDSVVGIATAYGLDDQGVEVLVPLGLSIFSSSRRPDRLWGPPNLLSKGYRELFPRG